jgi:hypothetical protein
MTLAAPRASLSADGKVVLLSRGRWSEVFSVTHLRTRLVFYRGMRDRKGGGELKGRTYDWPGIYGPVVVALERVEKVAKAMGVG